jgi:hypothetical protein
MLKKNLHQAVLILVALVTGAPAKANDVDNTCRAKRFRCESFCSSSNRVGSMEHLKCNEQCRDDESFCRKIGFAPDRRYY